MINYLRKYFLNNISSSVVTLDKPACMKADSGASKTYLKKEHEKYMHSMTDLSNGPKAILPDNSSIQASSQGLLPLHSTFNHKALVFPALKSESLLSIGQMCDEGCISIFDNKTLKIYSNDSKIQQFLSTRKQDNLVIKGFRNEQDGLYDVPFPKMK